MKKYFFLVMLVFLTSCATLGMLVDEAKQIEAEEIQPYTESVGALISDMVPSPYKMPAAIGVGYILALIRRLYKRKKGSTA